MSQVTISTSFNIDVEFELSPFHKRMLAWMIDLAIQTIYMIAANIIISTAHIFDNMEKIDIAGVATIVYLPVLCYHLLWEVFNNGQSPGKMLLRIRVISEDGGKPSLSQFILRWLMRMVDFSLSLGLGALLSVVISEKSQRLGDLAAGTILISTTQVNTMGTTAFVELESDYVPKYPQAMLLSDKDISRIRQMIEYAFDKGDLSTLDVPAQKIKNALKIESNLAPAIFLRTLVKDYNYLSIK